MIRSRHYSHRNIACTRQDRRDGKVALAAEQMEWEESQPMEYEALQQQIEAEATHSNLSGDYEDYGCYDEPSYADYYDQWYDDYNSRSPMTDRNAAWDEWENYQHHYCYYEEDDQSDLFDAFNGKWQEESLPTLAEWHYCKAA